MEISHGAYYNYANGKTYQISLNRQLLLKEVKDIFGFHKRRYGARRIWEEMKDNGSKIGLYRVKSLMKEQDLVAIQPKRFVPRTTKTSPNLRIALVTEWIINEAEYDKQDCETKAFKRLAPKLKAYFPKAN